MATSIIPTREPTPVVDNTPGTPGGPRNAPKEIRPAGADALARAIRQLKTDTASGAVKIDTNVPLDQKASLARADAADNGTPPPTPAPATAPARTEAAVDDDAASGASGEQTGPYQDASGRWRDANGAFIKDPNAAGQEPLEGGTKQAAAPAEPDPELVPFKLEGLTDRGEEDFEIDVSPEVAERLKRLEKNGMRKEEYTRRMDSLQTKESEWRVLESQMQTAPDAFVLGKLSKDAQLKVAVAILAEHWDLLVPGIVEMNEKPHVRELVKKDNQIAMRDLDAAARTALPAKQAEAYLLRTVEETIPDGAAERQVKLFRTAVDQEARVWAKNNPGMIPRKDEMNALLEDVARDFGWTADHRQTSAPAVAAAAKPVATTRPAAPVAKRVPVDEATRRQAVAQGRAIARRVVPAGAGGMPVDPPRPPSTKGSKTPLSDLFKGIRANPDLIRASAG